MKKLLQILLKFFRPHFVLILLLTPLSIGYMIFIFSTHRETTIPGYISHALSAYTLTVIIVNMQEISARIRWLIHESGPGSKTKALIYGNKYGNLYMSDKAYRAKVALYAALSMNILFAVLRLLSGIYYASFWYGADAIFYILLSTANFLLLRFIRKDDGGIDAEYRLYRFCGFFLFAIGIALIGLVVQIVYQNMAYEYPDLLIFAVATYAFACLVTAIVNVFSYRKLNSPVLSAAKALRLARALVAIFALQTAMLNAFAQEDFHDSQRLLNALTGGGVCLLLFGIALFMVIEANRKLKKLKEN